MPAPSGCINISPVSQTQFLSVMGATIGDCATNQGDVGAALLEAAPGVSASSAPSTRDACAALLGAALLDAAPGVFASSDAAGLGSPLLDAAGL